MTDHYNSLGVGKSASKAEIRAAYRRRARKTHPDKGGAAGDFQQVQKAYAILGDDSKRANYDAGGEEALNPKQQAVVELGNLLTLCLEQEGDLVERMKGAVKSMRAKDKDAANAMRRKANKLEKMVKSLRYKGKDQNLLAAMIEVNITRCRGSVKLLESRDEVFVEMLTILANYEVEPSEEAQALSAQFYPFDPLKELFRGT